MVCRAANAAYAASRRVTVGVVSASRARAHLEQLEQQGIGAKQVAKLSGVARSVVAGVRSGAVPTLRPSTARRLLATPAIPASGALVAATTSWRRIDSLEREGYTRRELAWTLGARSQQLQLGRRMVRASTVAKVQALYARLAE